METTHPRRRLAQLIFAACCLVAPLADAAGLRAISVPQQGDAPSLSGLVWTPCAAPAPQMASAGSGVPPAVKDCPINGRRLPLVVVSHGRRGSTLAHYDTAAALADAGFVVAAINHPGDNTTDSSRTDEFSVLVERPADIKRLVDFMTGVWESAAVVDPRRIGLFGFSRGAYTGLVVIGGDPDFSALAALCPAEATTSKCVTLREGKAPQAPAVHDFRVGAAILADPPAFPGLFSSERLARVTIPLLLWRSQFGGDGVTPEAIDALERLLPAHPDYRVAANSAHFAFVVPCPPELAKAIPALCTDPAGFDRAAFHEQFNAAVVEFFRAHLASGERRP